MPNVITTIRPTTELEAVNSMLAAIGEAPLADGTNLATASQADIETALNILTNITRKVLSMGWRFNTEKGVQLSPVAAHNWTDTNGTVATLNIFKRPVDVLAWSQTSCPANAGIDLVERRSKGYQETGAAVMVLYDRYRNRDGPEASGHPYVYLDAVYAFDFEDMPETAREYVMVRSARKFSQEVLGSETLRGFTAQDEADAFRTLKRDQGLPVHLNMLHTAGATSILGRRPRPFGGYSSRVYPGKA
jgi:hypothetical protein